MTAWLKTDMDLAGSTGESPRDGWYACVAVAIVTGYSRRAARRSFPGR